MDHLMDLVEQSERLNVNTTLLRRLAESPAPPEGDDLWRAPSWSVTQQGIIYSSFGAADGDG